MSQLPSAHPQTLVRTRFAPSPTGFIHVGNIRTGLFAYLLAKQSLGTFVLRIEDTDKKREVEGSIDHIKSCLKLLGCQWDEGIDIGGPYEPYLQSERLDHYRHWAQKLIDAGRAYADPYTSDQMQNFRESAQAEKRPFLYRDHRPEGLPVWDGTVPLRFRSDPKEYSWHDEVMGDMVAQPENIDDFVLIKSDGYPTYDFAHIIDDAEMAITHVIRGQEFVSSMPKYLNLYEALELTPPKLAHMPHIMNEQGNKKLGKRDGAKDVLDYLRDGYLPETMVSFIASMGWNDGTEQEVFTMKELVEKFSLNRVQRSGARFDEKRLLWMNGQLIRALTIDDIYGRVTDFWPVPAVDADESYKRAVLTLAQDRLKTLADLRDFGYFFTEPTVDMTLITENKQLKKLSHDEVMSLITATHNGLAQVETWTAESIQNTLNQLLLTTGQKPGTLFSLVRIITTWAPFSPALDQTLELLGQSLTLARLESFCTAHRS